ncbi:MAG TPA: DinB family protein [Brevefilum sp.]
MTVKKSIQSQYLAALAMLKEAIEKCPDSLWADSGYVNPFWHVAYHVLFYTHFYLSLTAKDFIPWEQHRDEITSLEPSVKEVQPYSKEDILEYLEFCLAQVEAQVSAMDLEAESGFYWLPFDKLELQLYNIRHIQQHTGELCERLGAHGEIEIGWVGMMG